jgi:DNA polymerase-3 subunit beta
VKIVIDRARMTDALKTASVAVAARPLIPILAGVLLDAGEDTMRLDAFDLESMATATTRAHVVEPGRVLVPYRLLAQVLAVCPPGDIRIDAERGMEIVAGRATWRLPLLPIEDFPALPIIGAEVALVDGARFADAIEAVAAAASDKAGMTPPLDVVHIGIEDRHVTLAASDGFRLHSAVVDAEITGTVGDFMLAPAERLRSMAKNIPPGPVAVFSDGNLLALGNDTATIATRLADSTNGWMNTQQAVAIIDRAALTQALKQVGGFGPQAAQGHRHITVSFHGQGELSLHGGTDSEGSGSTTIPTDHDGPGLRTVVNVAFLLDCLATCSTPTVRLAFSHPTKPVGIADGDGPVSQVLMPVRTPECAWLDDALVTA